MNTPTWVQLEEAAEALGEEHEEVQEFLLHLAQAMRRREDLTEV